MVCPGNHECECHSPRCIISSEKRSKLSNFTAYNCRWQMPSETSGGKASMWYSWDFGPIHFTAANTETDFEGASEQKLIGMHIFPAGHFGRDGEYLEWLEADLKKADTPEARAIRPWLIVYGHRPMYRDGKAECCEPALCAAHEGLLTKYHVDVYICGHAHLYNRNVPLDGSRPLLLGPGGAGCDEWPNKGVSGVSKDKNKRFEYMWDAINFSTAIMRVNRTHLEWHVINSKTNETVDYIVIEAWPHGPPGESLFGAFLPFPVSGSNVWFAFCIVIGAILLLMNTLKRLFYDGHGLFFTWKKLNPRSKCKLASGLFFFILFSSYIIH